MTYGLGLFGKKRRFSLVWTHLPSHQLPKTSLDAALFLHSLILKSSTVHVLHPIAFSFLPLNGYLIQNPWFHRKNSLFDFKKAVYDQQKTAIYFLLKGVEYIRTFMFILSSFIVCIDSHQYIRAIFESSFGVTDTTPDGEIFSTSDWCSSTKSICKD